ncbi:hypothetical protein HFK83_24870 [Ralstonia pseudosolanacearum]|uniref:hypothetical protein n=1 Tax=Ralstonia solanacearum species complex TaxID=3116862 RepID=UPI0013C2AACA|nr:hypothetical protein [Ralstonia pseudosolanacearum]MCK4125583.1 hypothetical protein [Ralstonia pseudosolanacearum]
MEATLEGFRANQDLRRQRLHVWNVFAGLTEPTPDGKFARWETWYSEDEAFQVGPAPQSLGPHRVQRRFKVPRQFTTGSGATPQAAGSGLLSFVLFNYETYKHIRDSGLYRRATVDGFAKTGLPDRHFPNNRTIPEFPTNSMSLKVIWWPVAHDKITAMPIWDGDPTPNVDTGKPFQVWPRVVAIAPSGIPEPDATANVNLFGKPHPGSHLVPLSAFHSVRLDADLVQSLNNDPQLAPLGNQVMGRQFQVGDYVVLAGMHMTTKEIKDWVWATFWWHDKPNEGPFSADRPTSLVAPWSNYLMSASYDVNTPKEQDGTPHITFNPWIEARFKNGVNSNCMTCHARASNNGTPFLPITRGDPTADDAAFSAGSVRTDFLWSIPDNAVPVQ